MGGSYHDRDGPPQRRRKERRSTGRRSRRRWSPGGGLPRAAHTVDGVGQALGLLHVVRLDHERAVELLLTRLRDYELDSGPHRPAARFDCADRREGQIDAARWADEHSRLVIFGKRRIGEEAVVEPEFRWRRHAPPLVDVHLDPEAVLEDRHPVGLLQGLNRVRQTLLGERLVRGRVHRGASHLRHEEEKKQRGGSMGFHADPRNSQTTVSPMGDCVKSPPGREVPSWLASQLVGVLHVAGLGDQNHGLGDVGGVIAHALEEAHGLRDQGEDDSEGYQDGDGRADHQGHMHRRFDPPPRGEIRPYPV
jgi:hypothetical protein